MSNIQQKFYCAHRHMACRPKIRRGPKIQFYISYRKKIQDRKKRFSLSMGQIFQIPVRINEINVRQNLFMIEYL